ncbi:hypothetical protein JRO89_XS07G0151200 [Xanthoceras sorbifolium]|uniref:Uncharacterized protein n=1 Tax=Xanthoceras sorbifolium TaxID=99658 RepID=A0ABQ8HU23_9ROSI|nr:hypothetical protein JRO89_XS07G0151200 [Xanthoceras sorbifolium]
MEGDLTGKLGDILTFDFNFEDEFDLIGNPFCQAHPDNQLNPTIWNLSYEHAEQGSSTGSNPPITIFRENLTRTIDIANIEHSNHSPEIAPNIIALPSSSSVNSDSIIGSLQAYNPTTEISSILQLPIGENNLPQFDQVNTNPSLPEQAHISHESTNQPLITPFSGAPQPYFSTLHEQLRNSSRNSFQPSKYLDHVELGSSTGSSQSLLNYLGFEAKEPSLGNATYLHQTKSNFFPSPSPETAQNPITTKTVPEHYEVLSNHLNTRSENSLQSEFLPYNDNQQTFHSTGLGIENGRSYINQYPSPCLLNYQNSLYPPLNPSRPQTYQPNQVSLPPNVQNLQGPSMLALRLPIYHQQLNEVAMAPFNPIMPTNGPMLVPKYMIFHFPPWSQELNDPIQQLISGQLMPNAFDLQIGPPSQSLMITGTQQLPNHGPINKSIPVMSNMFNPHGNNSLLLDPSMDSRPRSLEQQGLLNQTARPSVACPGSSGSSQSSQVLNLLTQRKISGHNPSGTTISELEMSLNNSRKQEFLGPRRRSRYEVGESSSAPKRPRREKIGQENGPQASVYQSIVNRGKNVSRPLKNTNSLYDPLFASIGLPVDPHLRRFAKIN